MEQNEFTRLADECLIRAAKWLEQLDPDEVDYIAADGVVTVEFADGDKFVLSRQAAASQVWLAAGAHGYHFNWNGERRAWIDDKDGMELKERFGAAVSERLGYQVEFTG